MKTYNITEDIYFKMSDMAENGDGLFACVELEDGCAITFDVKNSLPCDVKVFDEEDNVLEHDFSLERYKGLIF